MKKIALCIYTDNIDYNPEKDSSIHGLDYEIFFEFNPQIFHALRMVAFKKRLFELKHSDEFEVCIAYNPMCASLKDINVTHIKENTIYYAYGKFDRTKYRVGANPALFYCGTLEFNRACEFADNIKNIRPFDPLTVDEQFLFHTRSLFLKDECVNYENSSLFIRTT